MKVYTIHFDPICDCCHTQLVGVFDKKEEAINFVKSKGKYSDYDWLEWEIGEIND